MTALELINNIIENKYNTLNQIIKDIDELKNNLNIVTESGEELIEIQEESHTTQSPQIEQIEQEIESNETIDGDISLLPLLLLLDEKTESESNSLLPLLLLLD